MRKIFVISQCSNYIFFEVYSFTPYYVHTYRRDAYGDLFRSVNINSLSAAVL